MFRKWAPTSAQQPSFFYLIMADSCFRRAASTVHPEAGRALRDIGRDYLMRARRVTSQLEPTKWLTTTQHRVRT
jgi:hypothetical protein